ncbi:MAG: T9SS type A sorting domain-containing protein, partial [Sphingobacteriales bacterium]
TYNTELADLSDKRYLNFYLKMLTPVSPDFDMEVYVKDRYGNDPAGVRLKANGYVTSYTGEYQLVSVPLTQLFGNHAEIDKAQMTRIGWLSNQLNGKVDFKVDDIYASGSLVHDVKIRYSNPGCNVKGIITVDSVLDATGPLSYYINGAVNPSGIRNNKFGNLSAGKHVIRVTGPNGFVYMEEVTLKDVELVINTTITPGNAGAIVKGGSGSYTYLWSNGATTPTLTNVAEGSYTLKVTDRANGCKTTVTVNIPAIPVVIETTKAGCTANGSIRIVSIPGGLSTVQYYINNVANPAGVTKNEFTGLLPGTYAIKIAASGGYRYKTSVTVGGSPSAPVVTSVAANGNITVNVTGGSGKFTYLWNNGATTRSLTNVAPGTYTVTVRDTAGGCETMHTKTLTASPSKTLSANTLSVYPNPVKNSSTINLHYQFTDGVKRQITLRDLYGKILYSAYITEATGDLSIALPELRGGMYVIRNEGKDPAALKILVQE